MCACACVCVYSCIFLDADKREALVKKNVFLARKQQLFANWPFFFFVRITKRSKNMQHLKP